VHVRLLPVPARLEVTDDGAGLSADESRAVLGAYQRGGPAPALDPLGAGLGLCIADELAAGWGERVRIRSTPGLGTTVGVALPGAGASAGDTSGKEAADG
jgi:signal transduction histidine kinase